MMIRKVILSLSLVFCAATVSLAQDTLNVAQVFRAMPDSVMPYLTENNRLDMIDFMQAGMRAEVTNKLGGKSVMTFLSADSLSIDMSAVMVVSVSFSGANRTSANGEPLIKVEKTYSPETKKQSEVVIDFYSSDWVKLYSSVGFSTLLNRDDDVFSRPLQR